MIIFVYLLRRKYLNKKYFTRTLNMKLPAIFKLFLAILFVLSIQTGMYAIGIGVYGSYNYGSLESKFDDSDSNDDSAKLKSTLMGGGFVLDTAIARDTLFNYRLQIGGGMLNFKDDEDESEFETYQVSCINNFGFGVVRTDIIRFWLGAQIGGHYFIGKHKEYDDLAIAGYGGTAGPVLGVNLHLGKLFSIGIDGGYRYSYSKAFTLDTDSISNPDAEKTNFTLTGFEAFGSIFFIFRIGDTYSRRTSYTSSTISKAPESTPDDFSGAPNRGDLVDYNNLPRASVKQLTKEYGSLREDLFRGSLYPKRFFKIPRKLRKHAQNKERLILVSTKSGKFKVLMFISKNMVGEFKKKIKSKDRLDFVYSPVDVYKRKRRRAIPVIKFVDEILE